MRGGTGWLSTRQISRVPVVLGKLWSDIPALGVPLGSGDTVYEVLVPDLDPETACRQRKRWWWCAYARCRLAGAGRHARGASDSGFETCPHLAGHGNTPARQ